jgi:hypothetical protein
VDSGEGETNRESVLVGVVKLDWQARHVWSLPVVARW